MAKNEEKTTTVAAPEAPEAQTTVATADQKEKVYAELKALVDAYNESAEFAEFKKMKELDAQISEKVDDYTVLCENECFCALLRADDPMTAAATALTFATVTAKDQKQEQGGTLKVIEPAEKKIDPMRLHRKSQDLKLGGIGHDKLWWAKVEHLHMLLTAATAAELSAVNGAGEKLDFRKIRDTFAMAEEAKKVEMAGDKGQTNKAILADLQAVVDAMIGEGHTVEPRMVAYLRKAHENVARGKLALKVTRDSNMRWLVLNICNAAITGDAFKLEYKVAKAAK